MYYLGKELTISNVEQVRRDLLEYLQQQPLEEEIILDATHLEEIDAAGVQLLLSACCKTTILQGRNIRLVNVGDHLRRVLEISGGDYILEKGCSGGN